MEGSFVYLRFLLRDGRSLETGGGFFLRWGFVFGYSQPGGWAQSLETGVGVGPGGVVNHSERLYDVQAELHSQTRCYISPGT